jgi:SAM-dependent methyltransferase
MKYNNRSDLKDLIGYTQLMTYCKDIGERYGVEKEHDLWSEFFNKCNYETIWGEVDSHKSTTIHGIELGDVKYIKDNYVLPNISDKTVLELGSGDGRWTKYLTGCNHLICVDMIPDTEKYVNAISNNISFILNNGYDLREISSDSIDFLFVYDALLGTEKDNIKNYFKEFSRVLKSDGKILINLPIIDKYISRLYKFTPLELEEIRKMFIDNDLIIDVEENDILEYSIVIMGHK